MSALSARTRLIICIEGHTQIRIAETFADHARRQTDCDVIFTTSDPDTEFAIHLREQAGQKKIAFLNSSDETPWAKGFFARMFDRLLGIKFGGFYPIGVHARTFLQARRVCAAVLERAGADIAIVLEDGIAGPAVFIAEARKRKMPVIVLPYEMSQRKDLENTMRVKAGNGDVYAVPTGPKGYLIRIFAKHWICPFQGLNGLMFAPDYVLARVLVGLDMPDPWVTHGGQADRIAVESIRADEIYGRDGIPARKRVITGSPYLEAMATALDHDARARAAFENNRPVNEGRSKIMVSLPPSYGPIGNEGVPFTDYVRTLIEGVRALSGSHLLDINLFLHPAMGAEDREVIKGFEEDISEDWIIPSIPRHDIVISFFSSTVRWALAAGKPVINLDPYGWDLDLYNGDPGFIRASSVAHMVDIMADLIQNGLENTFAALNETRTAWGVIRTGDSKNIVNMAKAIQAKE